MSSAMIVCIILSQQVIMTICGIARALFKKLGDGGKAQPPLREDTFQNSRCTYPPNASFLGDKEIKKDPISTSVGPIKDQETGKRNLLTIFNYMLSRDPDPVSYNKLSIVGNNNNSNNNGCDYSKFLVPKSDRSFVNSKFDCVYDFMARSTRDIEDELDLVRNISLPSFNDNTIMMVVDQLIHNNKGMSHCACNINKPKRRFSRAQRYEIWARGLTRQYITLVRPLVAGKLQANEDIDSMPGPQGAQSHIDDHEPISFSNDTRADLDDAISNLRKRSDCVRNFSFGNSEDMFNDYGDLILPIAIFMYNIYRSRNTTDAIVAVVNFAEKLSSRSGHARVRAAATWATAYFGVRRDEIQRHLQVLCEHFKTSGDVKLQSSDYMSAFASIATGITKSAHVRAFVYLTAFAFMGVTASVSGISPDINEFSKQALAISNRADIFKSSTGVTLGLLTQAIQMCAELCSSFMKDGFQAFWSTDSKLLKQMHDNGKEILLRASKFDLVWEHKEMVRLGVDLQAYIDIYKAKKSRFDVYKAGSNFAGVSFNSETNLAIMWQDVRKVAEAIISAYEDYKAVIASVSFRMAPMCMCLVAGSSVGKSSVTQYFAKYFLHYEGMEDDMKYVYTVNPNQQYLDGYHPWQSVFVLDDVATVRPEYMKEGDPQVLGVIQYVNNVALLTNQADLSRKATTPFLSRYVIMTTNMKDLNAHKYANNYPAILRRVKWFIHVDVDPNFSTSNGTLDASKCEAWYGNGGRGIPPFWLYTIELCEVHNSGTTMRNSFTTVRSNIDFDQLQDWLRITTDAHWNVQNVIMKNVSASNQMSMCPNCKKLSGSKHGANCPSAGSVVQSMDDVAVVGQVVLASTAAASMCAMVISIGLWCFNYGIACARALYERYRLCCYYVTFVTALAADVGYTIALAREYVSSTSRIGSQAVSGLNYLFVAMSMIYLPWTWTGAIMLALSRIPSRGVVVGHVVAKNWLKPMVGLGVGLVAISAIWKHTRKHNVRVEHEQANEPDFSSYIPNPTWGQGRRRPYEGDDLTASWSTNSRCAAGPSHVGVMESMYKNEFLILVQSDAGKTRGNGFVYSPGYVVINAHTLKRHRGKVITVTLCYAAQETELGAPGEEKPRNYTVGKVDPNGVFYAQDRDLAMLYMPMETRKGLGMYVMRAGATNYGMDPHLIGRELNGALFTKPLAYRSVTENITYNVGGTEVFVRKCALYQANGVFKDGHSGSLYLIHSGRKSHGEYGSIGVAGIHMGVIDAVSGTQGFATMFDSDVLDTMKESLLKQVSTQDRILATRMGALGQNLVGSASLHADVMVGDGIFDLHKGSRGCYLGPTHPKSAISWLDYNPQDSIVSLTVYGSIDGDSRKSQGTSSAYYHTPWSAEMDRIGYHPVLGDLRNEYSPAQVRPEKLWEVHRACVLDLCGGDCRGPDTEALNAAVSGYVSDVISRVEASGNSRSWSLIQPLTYEEVINGRDGIFDGIVKKTGGGFGYSGPKSKHVKVLNEPIPGLHKTGTHWTFDDDVMDSVRVADEMLRRGEDPRFVYTSHLKDEVRSASKIKANKVRMICGASIPCIVLMRKYLLTLIIFMQQNPVATECAVGLNVESRQWTDLANYLRDKGGDDRHIPGDHKNFDKNQTFPISYAASRAMLLMVQNASNLHGKFDAGDMMAVKTLLLGLCHPNYDFFGTLVRVLGTNPSGNSLTTQRNCIVNSLYMRCAFVVAAKIFTGADPSISILWYCKAVAQINYGDDIVASVAEGFSWFNHDVVAKIMRGWGLVFTHADKSEDVGRPYERFEDVTFLKRSWVYDDSISGYHAPLEPASLVKSLHYYHRGGALSIVQQQVCLIRDVAENALSYGRDKYGSVCDFLRKMADKAGFSEADYQEATDFTTYDDYLDRYARNSEGNLKFLSVGCDMAPPRMLDNVPSEYMQLVKLQSSEFVTNVDHYPLNVDACTRVDVTPCELQGIGAWMCRPAWSYMLTGSNDLAMVEWILYVYSLWVCRLFIGIVIMLSIFNVVCNRRRGGRLWPLASVLFVSMCVCECSFVYVYFCMLVAAIFALCKIREGSFNPYGNGQWCISDIIRGNNVVFHEAFKSLVIPLLDSLLAGSVPDCEVCFSVEPFDHVAYVIDGQLFAHIDMDTKTIRTDMVSQLSNCGGYVMTQDFGVHEGRWSGSGLNFPGMAATTPYFIGGWTVRRRSACVPGEGLRTRVTKFECVKEGFHVSVGVFSQDCPRRIKRKFVDMESCPSTPPTP